jgi:hypothetical protein
VKSRFRQQNTDCENSGMVKNKFSVQYNNSCSFRCKKEPLEKQGESKEGAKLLEKINRKEGVKDVDEESYQVRLPGTGFIERRGLVGRGHEKW